LVPIAGPVWGVNGRQAGRPPAPLTSPVSVGSPAAPPLSAPPPPAAKPPVAPPPEDLGAKTRETAPAAADVPPTLEDLVTRVMPAVVTIPTAVGRSSGIFLTPDSVLTKVHVSATDST